MKALIVYGGWSGHDPEGVSQVLADVLSDSGFQVERSDTLGAFDDAEKLMGLDLIVPVWTMGKLPDEQWQNLSAAVESGVGIAGQHGGMGDAFRENCDYQFMVGGQFVAHPGGIIDYHVDVVNTGDPITAGIEGFDYRSEQYYVHVDPSNEVLATTTMACNGAVMPVVWKRTWGKGRVFYSSLGHVASEYADFPEALEIQKRGMLWAAEGELQSHSIGVAHQ